MGFLCGRCLLSCEGWMMEASEPTFQKIKGMIPYVLFIELQRRGLFLNAWDDWLTEAIRIKLREDDA